MRAAEVRLVTGETAAGTIRFVAKTASQNTTYRVEVEMVNPDSAIPDGITAQVSVPLANVNATRIPRSALTISSSGDAGVRTVGQDGTVGFTRIDACRTSRASCGSPASPTARA